MAKADVCIWMPTGLRNVKDYLGTVLGVGHASLRLWTGDRTPREDHYITWSAQGDPCAGGSFHPKDAFDRLHYQVGERERLPEPQRSFDYQWDRRMGVANFGHEEPDHTIKLPTLSLHLNRRLDGDFLHGVHVDRILRFWRNRLNLPVADRERKYAFLSKKQNCTGCVVEALRAGGLDSYIERPNNWFVQDARTLLTWVEEARAKIKRLNVFQKAVNAKMSELVKDTHSFPGARILGLGGKRIPSYEEWKRESDRNVSFRAFAQRKEQIADLDELIKGYHSTGDKWIHFALLVKMQNKIYSHMTEKPRSDRAEAVQRLGRSVTLVLKSLLKDGSRTRLDGTETGRFADVSDKMHSWVLRTLADPLDLADRHL